MKLQKDEVSEVKWATLEEIMTMMDRGEMVPFYRSLIGLFFEMRADMGTIDRDRA